MLFRSTFLLLLLSVISAAGSSRHQKLYGGLLDDNLKSIVIAQDSGYVFVGTTALGSTSGSHSDLAFYKTNQFGDLLYSFRIGDNFMNEATAAKQRADGTYIICGTTLGALNDTGFSEIFLLRMDENGTILWENTFGQEFIDDAAEAMITSDQESAVIAGSSGTSALLLNVDRFGQLMWSTLVNGTPTSLANRFKSVCRTSDGGYVAVGSCLTGIDSSSTTNPTPIYNDLICKFNSTGTLLWSRLVNDTLYSSVASSITNTPDGGFLVTGDFSVPGINPVKLSVYKLDATGTISWWRNFDNNDDSWGRTILYAGANRFVAGGECKTANSTHPAPLLIASDSTGQIAWQWQYGDGIIGDLVWGIDGGYALAGMNFSPGNTEAYFIKTNDTGYTGCSELPTTFVSSALQRTTVFSGAGQPVQLNEGFAAFLSDPYINQFGQICSWIGMDENRAVLQPMLFPNPANDRLSVINPLEHAVHIQLTDIAGKPIEQFELATEETKDIDLRTVSAGVYLLKYDGYRVIRFVKQ